MSYALIFKTIISYTMENYGSTRDLLSLRSGKTVLYSLWRLLLVFIIFRETSDSIVYTYGKFNICSERSA